MLEHEFIKIEAEDLENGTENNKHNEQQQIKYEDDLLDIKVEVAELEVAEDAHINLNTNKYSENKNKSKNERNCKNVSISHRISNKSACSNDSSAGSDNVNTKPCCNICFLYMEQKIVLNCKFCDLNYANMSNTKGHLHDDHKMFHLIDDISQENTPQKSAIALPQTNCDELLDYCGNVLKLKHGKFFIVCGSSEIEYAMDLFERHVPHHDIFEQSRIKLETEAVDTAETFEDTMKLAKLIKLEKETIIDTIQPETYINYNKNQSKDFTTTALEPNHLQAPTQNKAKIIDKKRCSLIKTTMENKISPVIVQEESSPDGQSYRDQIKKEYIEEEQSLLKPLYEEQIPKSILENNTNPLECDKQLTQITNLNDKKFNCTLCDLPYFSEKELNLHIDQHSADRIYKCTECSKGFKRKADLKIHLRVHSDEKPFACDICSTCFRAKQNLVVHRLTHMGEAVKTYECEYCDKKFLRNSDRKSHIRTHTGEKPYKCEICQRGYSSKFNLKFHLNKDHTSPEVLSKAPIKRRKRKPIIGDGLFKCSECSKGFKRKSDLKNHVRIHTGEKPFVCDICNTSFRAKQNLSMHRKFHMGEAVKTYQCEYCNKKFLRNSDRKSHIRKHTGEKPHKCDICQRGYSSKTNLKFHLARDHTLLNKIN